MVTLFVFFFIIHLHNTFKQIISYIFTVVIKEHFDRINCANFKLCQVFRAQTSFTACAARIELYEVSAVRGLIYITREIVGFIHQPIHPWRISHVTLTFLRSLLEIPDFDCATSAIYTDKKNKRAI